MEVWKEVPCTYGLLEVSNLGRVRSKMRDGRILKLQTDSKGYQRVRVTIKGQKRQYKIHRLVASVFIPNPLLLPQINHKDGNKQNNAVSNLEWISNKDNAYHAIKAGLWGNVFSASERVNRSRMTPVTSIDIESGEVRHFASVSEAERFFNTRHISDVLKGKRTKAAGQRFKRG